MLIVSVAAGACASDPDRRWMKAGPYTTAEFTRDAQACTSRGDLDAACMESRGWIAVQAERTETAKKREGPAYMTSPPTRSR